MIAGTQRCDQTKVKEPKARSRYGMLSCDTKKYGIKPMRLWPLAQFPAAISFISTMPSHLSLIPPRSCKSLKGRVLRDIPSIPTLHLHKAQAHNDVVAALTATSRGLGRGSEVTHRSPVHFPRLSAA